MIGAATVVATPACAATRYEGSRQIAIQLRHTSPGGEGGPQAGATRPLFPPRIEKAITSRMELTSQMMIVAQT